MYYPPDTSGQFLALSSVLTGFNTTELQATGVAGQLWGTLERIIGVPIMGEMLSLAGRHFAKANSLEELEAIFKKGLMADPKFQPIAQRIIGMWYTGVWSPMPSAWSDVHGGNTNDGTFVISPAVYRAGLVWPAFGSHARSTNPEGYGAWGEPPLVPVNTNPPKE